MLILECSIALITSSIFWIFLVIFGNKCWHYQSHAKFWNLKETLVYSMHENDFVFYSTKNNNENSNTFGKIKPANECTKLSFPGLINI